MSRYSMTLRGMHENYMCMDVTGIFFFGTRHPASADVYRTSVRAVCMGCHVVVGRELIGIIKVHVHESNASLLNRLLRC